MTQNSSINTFLSMVLPLYWGRYWYNTTTIIRSGKLLLESPAQSSLFSSPMGPKIIFCVSRLIKLSVPVPDTLVTITRNFVTIWLLPWPHCCTNPFIFETHLCQCPTVVTMTRQFCLELMHTGEKWKISPDLSLQEQCLPWLVGRYRCGPLLPQFHYYSNTAVTI